jgi:hypothetical protein
LRWPRWPDPTRPKGSFPRLSPCPASIVSASRRQEGQGPLEMRLGLASLEYLTGRTRHALPRLRAAHTMLVQILGRNARATQLAANYLAEALCEAGHAEDAWPLLGGSIRRPSPRSTPATTGASGLMR